MINDLNQMLGNQTVYLYGAGDGGRKIRKMLLNLSPDVGVVFVDDNKTGFIDSAPVVKLENIANEKVYITSAYWHVMVPKLESLKLPYEVVNPNLFYQHILFTPEQYRQASSSIAAVIDLLETEDDKQLYRVAIDARIEPEKIKLLNQAYAEKFAERLEYLDFINYSAIDLIVEGGVLDGKNSLDFLNQLGQQVKIFGFEPLWNNENELIEQSENIEIVPKALWFEKSIAYFEANITSLESSKISEVQTGIEVETINIDLFRKERNLKIDYIKLDIEGAELQTLKGAYRTITEDRPQMAISIYHSNEEMYTIPSYLSQICDNYVFRLAHYSRTYWDTILYAIPRELYREKR